MSVPERFRPLIRDIVAALACDEVERLAADGRLARGAPAQLRGVLADYGGTFSELPDEAFVDGGAIDLGGGEWSVDVDLWTEEEGRTDLSLIVRIVERDGEFTAEVRDLRVM